MYTNMNVPSGIGKLDRERITAILRGAEHTVSVAEAAAILRVPQQRASQLLARWAAKGWFTRIKQGVYIPIPLESDTTEISLENPWIIAERLYQPCYIGAWSAATHWGLTEQIFRATVVFTVKKLRAHQPIIKGTHFLVHTISEQAMFGLRPIWYGQIKVLVSDPTRTMLDLLSNPKLGGGIRSSVDMFINYLKSEHKNLLLLIDYARRFKNGAVFKRLGFLLEQYQPDETEIIAVCKKLLTTGNVKLDPQLDATKLITRWRLWIPETWVK